MALLSAVMEKIDNNVEALRNLFGHDVLMIPARGKKAAIKWGHLDQSVMRDQDYLTKLRHKNVAVVLGPESGGLVSIDIDDPSFIEILLEKNPFLKETTRTEGKRGCNFWVRLDGEIPRTKNLFYKGKKVGEFRGDGGYTIIAGLHPNGVEYRITNRVPPLKINYPDLWLPDDKGLSDTERTDENRRGIGGGSAAPKNSEELIKESLPTGSHQNHSCLFHLARGQRSLEEHAQYPSPSSDELFAQWHQSNQYLRKGKSKEDYYFEYLAALEKVKFPLGVSEIVEKALEKAKTQPPPPEAKDFDDEKMVLLLSLCRELQILSGPQPFFLACRKATTLIGHDSHATVNRWLKGFESLKLLEVVRRGGPHSNKANRYLYKGQMEGVNHA